MKINFIKKKNNLFESGFTLVELLVVISIVAIISGMLLSYSRGSEKQLILFKEQEKVVSVLQKARDMSLGAMGKDDVPCGYGVHVEAPNVLVIFKSVPAPTNLNCMNLAQIVKTYSTVVNDINQPCGGPLNSHCFQKIYLDNDIEFDAATTLDDIVFIPPEPMVFINDDAALYNSDIYLKIPGSVQTKRVRATKAGQVNAFN